MVPIAYRERPDAPTAGAGSCLSPSRYDGRALLAAGFVVGPVAGAALPLSTWWVVPLSSLVCARVHIGSYQ